MQFFYIIYIKKNTHVLTSKMSKYYIYMVINNYSSQIEKKYYINNIYNKLLKYSHP
jgi:hypothetical protein